MLQSVEIPFKSIFRVAAVFVLFVIVYLIRDLLLLLLLAIVFASGISPIVTWFENRRIPRLLGLLIVVVVVFSGLALLLRAVVPPLIHDFNAFASNFPQYATFLKEGLKPIGISPEGVIGKGLNQALEQGAAIIGKGVTSLPSFTLQVFGGIFKFATLMLMTFYLSLDRDGVGKFLRLFVPAGEESYTLRLWDRAQKQFGSWAQGQLLLMLLIGVISYIGFWLLGVQYALLLAFVAGLLEIVPVVGPVVAGGAAVLVTIFDSTEKALLVLLFFTIVQQLEGHIIVPLLYRRILKLHPVMVILALLIGARLAGPVGVLLAVPLAAVISEFLQDYSGGKIRL